METLSALFMLLFGGIIGSFLNVCILRIPEHRSISYPPSSCGSCGHRLAPKDLVPMFSYLCLRGKCRYCGAKVSIQYPVVEGVNALLYLFMCLYKGFTLETIVICVLGSVLLVILVIDLHVMLIPDSLVIATAICSVAYVAMTVSSPREFIMRIPASLVVSGGLLLLYLFGLFVLKKEVMGLGDLKLFIPIGFLLGVGKSFLCLWGACLLGALVVLPSMFKGRGKSAARMPFAPAIVVSTMLTLLWGDVLLEWYWGLFRVF